MKNVMNPIASDNGRFKDGNPQAGEYGTIVTAEFLNNVQDGVRDLQSEIKTVLAEAGIAPNNQTTDQLLTALKSFHATVGSINQLRQFDPHQDRQLAYLKAYYAGGANGGGYFLADFSDTTTPDDGATVVVTPSGKRWKRVYSTLTPFDFGAFADGQSDDTAALVAIAQKGEVVDLLGLRYAATTLPEGVFINGEICVQGVSHLYGLFPVEKKGFRIVSWNIWGGGSANAYFDAERFDPRRYAELKSHLLKMNGDFIGLQETYTHQTAFKVERYCVGALQSAVNSVSLTFENGDQFGNIILGSKNQVSSQARIYTASAQAEGGEESSYIQATFHYGDKSLSIYNTHLSLDEGRRASMIEELCTAVLKDASDAVFVVGDFNTNDWTAFAELTQAGFKQVNNNTLDTKPGAKTWFIDEIFYKGVNLTKRGTWVAERIADHSALFGDFEF